MPDTIAAIATIQAPSAIGIVRLTGPDTRRILDGVFAPANGRPMSAHTPRKLVFGRAIDRMREHQVLQTATLGQHTNDRMISFYMRTPSNFDIEFGYGGAVLDWNEHIVHEFTRTSLWGHDFSVSQQQLLDKEA